MAGEGREEQVRGQKESGGKSEKEGKGREKKKIDLSEKEDERMYEKRLRKNMSS